MAKPLVDRIALVTGASRGLGRDAAIALARAGAHVVAVARTVGGLEELDDAIRAVGGTATLVPLDMKDYAGIDRLAAAIKERYGRLDALVANAGILGPLSPIDHVQPEAWDDVIAINVTANYRLVRAFADLLKASDAGRAVFVTSGIATLGVAYWGPYAVSKAAVDVLTRTFAAETATTNLRVNALAPGRVRTRMLATAYPTLDMETIPTADKVAEKIVELCLPTMTESGKYFDFPSGTFLAFQRPC